MRSPPTRANELSSSTRAASEELARRSRTPTATRATITIIGARRITKSFVPTFRFRSMEGASGARERPRRVWAGPQTSGGVGSPSTQLVASSDRRLSRGLEQVPARRWEEVPQLDARGDYVGADTSGSTVRRGPVSCRSPTAPWSLPSRRDDERHLAGPRLVAGLRRQVVPARRPPRPPFPRAARPVRAPTVSSPTGASGPSASSSTAPMIFVLVIVGVHHRR